jgi:hypothetical protein
VEREELESIRPGLKQRLLPYWYRLVGWWNSDYDVICSVFSTNGRKSIENIANHIASCAEELKQCGHAETARYYHDEIVKGLRLLRHLIN